VRRHLAPGGAFALDVFNPKLGRMGTPEDPEVPGVRFRFEGDEIVRYERVSRDPGTQILRVRMRYQRERDGRALGSQEVEFQMRWFHRFELEHLLARAGFREIAIHGDFARGPFAADSPEIVAIAR
jgi:hypothetical protein